MSKGHVFLAQNTDVNYVIQAYGLALSIKNSNKLYNQTCLITSDTVPEEFRHAFDHIIEIPWGDDAEGFDWKIHNRWKIVHASPFKENIVYDTDMLLLSSNDHWWDMLSKTDVTLTSQVKTYKGTVVTSDYYRKTFTDNDLPNVYMGVHYFKKTKRAFEFYKWLEIITKDYNVFYDRFLPKSKQRFCSMDVNAALAVKFMDATDFIKNNSSLSFVHMKPAIQGWTNTPTSWQRAVTVFLNKQKQLNVGNFLQTGVFHYTEDDFLTKEKLDILK